MPNRPRTSEPDRRIRRRASKIASNSTSINILDATPSESIFYKETCPISLIKSSTSLQNTPKEGGGTLRISSRTETQTPPPRSGAQRSPA
jgi:hypothetical protein